MQTFANVMFYFNQYDINNDEQSIQTGLNDWLNRGNRDEINSKLIEVVQLDVSKSYIALFQLENDDLGYPHLNKGLNGKFKMEHSEHGTNGISYEEIKTNRGMYGILFGKNSNHKIDHISAELTMKNFSFASDVSEDEVFVKYKKLPSQFKQTFPAVLTYYDKNNNPLNN